MVELDYTMHIPENEEMEKLARQCFEEAFLKAKPHFKELADIASFVNALRHQCQETLDLIAQRCLREQGGSQ